jgi:hypothetical protein
MAWSGFSAVMAVVLYLRLGNVRHRGLLTVIPFMFFSINALSLLLGLGGIISAGLVYFILHSKEIV